MADQVSGHEHLVECTQGPEGDTLVVSCKGVEYARQTFAPGFPSEAVEWWLRAVTAEHLAGPPLLYRGTTDDPYWMGNFIADSRGRMRFMEQENAGIEWDIDASHEEPGPKSVCPCDIGGR